ncbi:VWA domain-containing protein [Chloroflexi bacterium CFX2]|nr:VWA domain-containing protein [Chloroflexi bacterium CFX2]
MFHRTVNVRTLFIYCGVFFAMLVTFGTPFEAEARTSPVPLLQGSAPAEVVISSPSVGTINVPQNFTATVSPGNVTTPITYTWVVWKSEGSIDGSETIIHTNGGLSDNLSFTWIGGGFKRISVRAENTNGYAIDEVFFPVEVPPFLTSPYPLPARATSVFDHSTPRYESDPNDYVLTWLGIRDNVISYDGHSGIDYAFGYLPIYAVADSVEVVFAGWKVPTNHNADVGLYVKLRHPNGYYTIYGHLNSAAVKSCTQSYCTSIKRGDVIGVSGDTGNSSGPHLHFEIRTPYDGSYATQVDPYGYSPSPESLDEDKERPAWTHTQPNSIWVDYPDVSISSLVLPDGAGNALSLPNIPNNGVIVDDYAHLPNDSAPNFDAAAECWERSSQKPAGYAENNYNLYKNAVISTDQNDYLGTCWARWYLPLDQPTGEYSVYVHIPRSDTDNFADNTLYRVFRAGNEIAKVTVSQFGVNRPVLTGSTYSADPTVNSGWIYIGSYLFPQSDAFDNYVELTDKVVGNTIDVNDPNNPVIQNPKVAVDALKFVRAGSLKNVDTVLIVDSSGSMSWNDPQNKRLQASRFFVTNASVQDDYVGVVDFDGGVRVATNPPLQNLHDNDTNVVAAINTINSSGGTNIGIGIQAGCDVLNQSDRFDYKKGAILLTDGDGGFSGQDACFSGKGWPIFTFGFGDANDALLQQIATNTGGRYARVDNLTSLTCEFIRVRSLIANVEPQPCFPYIVPQLASISFSQTIAPRQAQATFSTGWPGSDVIMTLTSPSGRVIDRSTVAPDVLHENGPTYEVYTILNPESGNWNVNLYGADVPTGGEEVIFGFASIPAPEGVFPTTPILDDFNRAGGAIGNNWSGNTFGYNIFSNQLSVDYSGSNSDIYWSNEPFGADQEAYVTFAQIDPNAGEQDLLLKSQSNTTWGDGVLEVWYDVQNHIVKVMTWEWPAEWVQHGEDIPVTFVDGDTFGARALADGTVEVYRNGELLAVRDITSWPHYADGGYVGLWFIGAEDAVLDGFGGGTITVGMQSMSMGGTIESQSAETSLTPEQLNVTLTNVNVFWQGVPIGSNQKAYVTFAQLDKGVGTLSKPQSNGAWGEGIVQVLYDVTGGRIQVWMYDPQKGWVQVGDDVPVQFAEGDVFSVRVLANGMVEIQRSGKPLAKRDVTP